MEAIDLQYGALLDALHGLRWPARRPSRRLAVAGAHRSARRGSSPEFAEHREFRPGDDPRRLDWKLLARSGRTYLRLAVEGATMPTELVLDASASMAFPVGSHEKWELARRLGVALTSVGYAGGDPMGMRVVSGQGVARVHAAARRSIVREVAQLVSAVTPSGAGSVEDAIADGSRAAARLVVVSDFLTGTDAIVTQLRAFAALGGEAYAVHVIAAEELDPVASVRLVSDPEAPDQQRAFRLDERAAYRVAFATWRDALARDVRAAGAWYTMVVTGEESAERAARRIVAPTEPVGLR